MKSILALLFVFYSGSILYGQHKTNIAPFIIKGQITGCPEKKLQLFFRNKIGQVLVDTLTLDDSGYFYLKTFKVNEPQRADIQHNNIQINDLFVAPGYHLTIKGTGKDFLSLLKSKTITGIGSESNSYQFLLDSIMLARKETTSWPQLNDIDLLAYIKRDQKLKDSIAHIVFDRNSNQDKFLSYFGSLTRLDNKLSKLYMLLLHVKWNNYSYEKSISFVRQNFDDKILDNMCQDEYLNSSIYRTGLIGNEYLTYLVDLDYKKDSTLRGRKDYKLKKANELYKGKVKEYVLFSLLESRVEYSESFEKLNSCKEQYEAFISNFRTQYYKQTLTAKFEEKEAELLRTQVGKPAPNFTLQSNLGNTYSLVDLKGKVVYLDLWASWCMPCRAETPAFRLLYTKYKDNDRIVF